MVHSLYSLSFEAHKGPMKHFLIFILIEKDTLSIESLLGTRVLRTRADRHASTAHLQAITSSTLAQRRHTLRIIHGASC